MFIIWRKFSENEKPSKHTHGDIKTVGIFSMQTELMSLFSAAAAVDIHLKWRSNKDPHSVHKTITSSLNMVKERSFTWKDIREFLRHNFDLAGGILYSIQSPAMPRKHWNRSHSMHSMSMLFYQLTKWTGEINFEFWINQNQRNILYVRIWNISE